MTAAREPGVLYDGVSDVEYHADTTSLSASGAKLLAARTPYEFWWRQRNPPERKREFDIGHAAHRKLLGAGAEIEVIDAPNYNNKAAREQRDAAYDAGRIPLLLKQDAAVDAMVKRVHEHPVTAALFADGKAEQSGWWVDKATGIRCRVRPDWMTWIGDTLYLADPKTTADSDPDAFGRSAVRFGYHQQEPWYVEGIRKILGVEHIAFLFIAISTKPPHLITTHFCDEEALAEGERANRRAREIFARCMETGQWPEYSIEPNPIRLPRWHALTDEEGITGDD